MVETRVEITKKPTYPDIPISKKKPTSQVLFEASQHGRFESFINSPLPPEKTTKDAFDKIPFSTMWRKAIENPLLKSSVGDVGRKILTAVPSEDEAKILKATATSLGESFPFQVLGSQIDLPFLNDYPPTEKSTKQLTPPRNLEEFLEYASNRYQTSAQKGFKKDVTLPGISESWLRLARAIQIKDLEKAKAVFEDVIGIYNHEEKEAQRRMKEGVGYTKVRAEAHVYTSIAPVLAEYFPQIVVSHLRESQRTPVETNA